MDIYQKKHVYRIRQAAMKQMPKPQKQAKQFNTNQVKENPNDEGHNGKDKLMFMFTNVNNQMTNSSAHCIQNEYKVGIQGDANDANYINCINLQHNENDKNQNNFNKLPLFDNHQMKHIIRIRSELEKKKLDTNTKCAIKKTKSVRKKEPPLITAKSNNQIDINVGLKRVRFVSDCNILKNEAPDIAIKNLQIDNDMALKTTKKYHKPKTKNRKEWNRNFTIKNKHYKQPRAIKNNKLIVSSANDNLEEPIESFSMGNILKASNNIRSDGFLEHQRESLLCSMDSVINYHPIGKDEIIAHENNNKQFSEGDSHANPIFKEILMEKLFDGAEEIGRNVTPLYNSGCKPKIRKGCKKVVTNQKIPRKKVISTYTDKFKTLGGQKTKAINVDDANDIEIVIKLNDLKRLMDELDRTGKNNLIEIK